MGLTKHPCVIPILVSVLALDRSPEFKAVVVQIVCVVEIQSESAWALPNVTSGKTASEASGSEEVFNIFPCISLVQTQDILGRIHFRPWFHYLNKLVEAPQGNATCTKFQEDHPRNISVRLF